MRKVYKFFVDYPEYILIPVYILIYSFSLTFQYVEGDDAYSIMYHALGRHPEVQRPYAEYQAMMDAVMGIFPADEFLLRHIAIGIHALFGIIFPMLIVALIRTFAAINNKALLVYAVMLPFAVPEMIFFGLYYQCSSIAISLLLAAHVLLKRNLQKAGRITTVNYVIAVLLIGIGTGFRWEAGMYVIPMFLDLWYTETEGFTRKDKVNSTGLKYFILGVLSAVSVLLFIVATSDGLQGTLNKFDNSPNMVKVADGREISYKINIGSSLSLFTPFIVLTFFAGVYYLLKNRRFFELLLLALAYFYVPILLKTEFMNPRRVINSIPLLLAISFYGYKYFYESVSIPAHRARVGLLALLVALPWVIGIQIFSTSTAWGPGFEQNQAAMQKKAEVEKMESVDDRVNIDGVKVGVLKAGFAVPFEGPRPCWGYADVIFGGKWRKLLNDLSRERNELVGMAEKERLPVLQQDFGVNLMVRCVELGYTTYETKKGHAVATGILKRTFSRLADSSSIDFYFPANNHHLDIVDPAYFKELAQVVSAKRLLVYCYSTSIMTNVILRLGNNVQRLGPSSAIVDLDMIRGGSEMATVVTPQH